MSIDHGRCDSLAYLIAGLVPGGEEGPVLELRTAGEGDVPAVCVPGTVVAFGRGVRVRFALPQDAAADVIRLRLPAVPGCYRIGALTLGDTPVADLGRRRFDDAGPAGADGAWTCYEEHGAGIEFDVCDLLGAGAAAPAAPRDVVVEVAREPTAPAAAGTGAAVPGRIADALLEAQMSHAEALRRHASSLARLQARLHGEQMARLAGVADAAEARQSATASALDAALQAAVEATRDALRSLASDLEMMRTEQRRLAALVTEVRDGQRNVFWRRWARRLLRRPA